LCNNYFYYLIFEVYNINFLYINNYIFKNNIYIFFLYLFLKFEKIVTFKYNKILYNIGVIMKKLFIKEKQSNIILTLGLRSPQNILDICKKTDIIYAYTLNILKDLEEKKIVYSEKSGRERYYRLTDQGKEIYGYLKEFVSKMDKIEYGEAKVSIEEKKLEEYKKKIDDLKKQLRSENLEGTHSSQKLEALLDQLEQIEAQI